MAERIMVVSGKGGVGKSLCCTGIGEALAVQGKKVLLLEMDGGMRGLDILNGVEDQVLYDMRDVLLGRCEPEKAIVRSAVASNLFLLSASTEQQFVASTAAFVRLVRTLDEEYDMILMDCPAGLGRNVRLPLEVATLGLVVVTPDLISTRQGARSAELLLSAELPTRLIINRVPLRLKKTMAIPDLDAVIDMVGVQLIGVIPEDDALEDALQGINAQVSALPYHAGKKALANIASRIGGKYVPLEVG